MKSLNPCVLGTLEAMDGFSELQDGFMCFPKYKGLGDAITEQIQKKNEKLELFPIECVCLNFELSHLQ